MHRLGGEGGKGTGASRRPGGEGSAPLSVIEPFERREDPRGLSPPLPSGMTLL